MPFHIVLFYLVVGKSALETRVALLAIYMYLYVLILCFRIFSAMPPGVIVGLHSLIMTLPGDVLFDSSHEKTCRRICDQLRLKPACSAESS